MALAAVFLMVIFIGVETFGVINARRAIASGVVMADGIVEVDISVNHAPEPWSRIQAPGGLDLENRPEGIVAVSFDQSDTSESWLVGTDGWTRIDDVEYPIDWGGTFDQGFISQSATDGQTTVFTGVSEESLLSPDGNPTIWTSSSGENLEVADLPSLRSLGFGYLIGGFRLSDGIEHVIHTNSGFVAYTGYLQVWDGFEGLTLEPREAWASLLLTSPDGRKWTPHVLSDFGVHQMVPFGEGVLAAAALPPESDTVTVEVEGVHTQVAVLPENRLFYSKDGLTWEAVAGSPAFEKPLLAPTPDGSVIAVDEYRAEDPETPTTQIFVIEPFANTTD